MQEHVAAQLEELLQPVAPILDDVVLTGGFSIGLWMTEPVAIPARPTDDIDLIVAVDTRAGYERVAEQLRAVGLTEDSTSRVICRWRHRETGTIFDVMPREERVFGFANQWYPEAIRSARELVLPGGTAIRVAPPAVLIATKLEAYADRGRSDPLASHDMNDIIALFDGLPGITSEIEQAAAQVRAHVVRSLRGLLANDDARLAIQGYLPPNAEAQARIPVILERLREAASLDT